MLLSSLLPVVVLGVGSHVLAVSVSISLSAPSAAPSIAPSLIGLSLEQDRWLDWSGNTSRNNFFFNTLNNIVGITGQAPHIRIGANSEDHTTFNPNIQACISPPDHLRL